jgi:hypothetical protein
LHAHLPPGLDRHRVVEQLLDLIEAQFVHVPDLVGIHEARIAHHVAAVGQVDRQHGSTAVFDRRRAVIVQGLGDGWQIAAGEQALDAALKLRVDRQGVSERAVSRAGLLDQDSAVALEDRGLDLPHSAGAQDLDVV